MPMLNSTGVTLTFPPLCNSFGSLLNISSWRGMLTQTQCLKETQKQNHESDLQTSCHEKKNPKILTSSTVLR